MDAYAKSCLAKGEKLPEFPRDQFKKVNRKSQVNTVSNKIEAKPSNKDIPTKVTRDIVAENVTKQGKKLHVNPVKRIPATSNFVYEFNSFNVGQTRPLTSQTYLWHRNNSKQTLPHFKTDTTSFSKSASNHNLAKRKSSAILPELNSRTDFTTADTDSNVTNSSTKNTCLPLLNKEDLTRTLNEQIDKEYEQSDTEVENVKSAWQVLRGEKDWTKGKDHIVNAQTKKLYEMLKKIDRVQKNYMDPKANRYLRKSTPNVLRTGSKPNLQEEAESARSVIFPDRKARIKSAVFHLRNVDSEMIGKDMAKVRFDEAAENISTDNQSHKNLPSSKYTAKKLSIHTDAHDRNVARSVHTIASNICNKKRDTAVTDIMKSTDTKLRARIKSCIEEYLQCYGDNIHKSRGIDEDERSRDVKLSASDIANILANHNIESDVLYENFEKYSDYSDGYASENEDRSCSNTTSNATQVMSADTIQENKKIRENTSFENMGLYNDTRFTQATDVRSFDIQTQSSATNCQDNAFIKIGLNKDLSKDMLSQILQSEYLKKDLSL